MTTEQNKALQAIIETATNQLDTTASYLGMVNCAIIHNARRALLEICQHEKPAKKAPTKKQARRVDFMKFAGRLDGRGFKNLKFGILIKDGEAIATDRDSFITFNTDHAAGMWHIKNGVVLTSSRTAEDMPQPPDMGEVVAVVTIDPDMLKKIALASSVDETRRVLNGVCIGEDGKGNFYCVGTDGRRLHLYERQGLSELNWEVILGTQMVKDLIELNPEPFKLSIYKTHIWAGGDGWGYVSRLLDGQYPHFRQVIPSDCPHTCTFDRAQLLDQLKSVIMPYWKATEKKYSLRMSIAPEQITCSMDGEQGRAFTVPCQSTGVRSAALNIEYLVDILEGQPDAPVFHFAEGYNPILLKGEGYTGVLMPLRLN